MRPARSGRVGLALAAAMAASILCMGAASDDPAERLQNPAQEARARHMFQQLRCVVCQNESIDDSQADIAGDLRRIVRTQIVAGKSDTQIRDFLVARYGEFILLTPTATAGNAALWLTPFLLIVLGGGYLWIKSRQPAVEDKGLTEEELLALDAIDADSLDMVSPHIGLTKADGVTAIKH
jgi:cytochrome c-type biogenesis protein CcmH